MLVIKPRPEFGHERALAGYQTSRLTRRYGGRAAGKQSVPVAAGHALTDGIGLLPTNHNLKP
mgnify:CR=1 FL=1